MMSRETRHSLKSFVLPSSLEGVLTVQHTEWSFEKIPHIIFPNQTQHQYQPTFFASRHQGPEIIYEQLDKYET